MSTSNAFMASARKSKRAQTDIEKTPTAVGADEEMVVTNVRIPKSLHRKAQLRRIETGESMTALIRRLMEKELG